MSVRFVCGWRGRANVNVYRAIGILPQILAGQLVDWLDCRRWRISSRSFLQKLSGCIGSGEFDTLKSELGSFPLELFNL